MANSSATAFSYLRLFATATGGILVGLVVGNYLQNNNNVNEIEDDNRDRNNKLHPKINSLKSELKNANIIIDTMVKSLRKRIDAVNLQNLELSEALNLKTSMISSNNQQFDPSFPIGFRPPLPPIFLIISGSNCWPGPPPIFFLRLFFRFFPLQTFITIKIIHTIYTICITRYIIYFLISIPSSLIICVYIYIYMNCISILLYTRILIVCIPTVKCKCVCHTWCHINHHRSYRRLFSAKLYSSAITHQHNIFHELFEELMKKFLYTREGVVF